MNSAVVSFACPMSESALKAMAPRPWAARPRRPCLPVPRAVLPEVVHQRFAAFGLGGEVFSEDFPMVALTAPAGADFSGLKALLDHGQEDGWWHYELGCVTDEWQDAWSSRPASRSFDEAGSRSLYEGIPS
ncbi:hypothetical protein Skr01_67650 [Sphaerisporangium krabiense]|uniref:DUF4265 domain-containing protein n=1 Tax=Sphaerisporangium krabiense TaxID=763782 RepID=UPI00161C555B|nr:DUF4265 domain-containing protein [Sphaerisporangium krabiense]GII66680.1 hypothetical protein Skr01_67650 [Sphaerisporangium krabiense]